MVTQALSNPLTFEEFLAWYPEDGRRYELLEYEYWMVDYLGLGATRYIGRPKQPTIQVQWLSAGRADRFCA